MQTWSYQQITDPAFRESLVHQAQDLSGLVVLELSDKKIEVGIRQALFNLFWFPVLTEFNIPIRSDHFIKRRPFDKGALASALNPYYYEIMAQSQNNGKRLKQALWTMQQNLYRFCFDDLMAFVGSIDIEDMATINNEPVMKEHIDSKYQIDDTWQSSAVEKFIESHRKKIMEIMGTPGALKRQSLLPFQRVGLLNKFQVPQCMYAFGVRTDINDDIISLPVIGSSMSGLRDIKEFAVESRAAAKSQAYNSDAVSKSQYFNRKCQLNSSTVKNLYKGDCHSTQLVKFLITGDDPENGIKSNANNCIGKVIVEDGKYVVLTKKNIGNYINKYVFMRSPMTCRYRNGVCEVCGGTILGNLNRKLNVGMLSSILTIEPVTQKILSAKHLIKTSSIEFTPDEKTRKILQLANSKKLYWTKSFTHKLNNSFLGIPSTMFSGWHDVTLLRGDKVIIPSRMSRVAEFFIKNGEAVSQFSMARDKQTPFLSEEMLNHIRAHYSEVKMEGNIIWIPITGTENMPIFNTIVINDNMIAFVGRVQNFMTGASGLASHTSCSTALKEFTEVVLDKVDNINIVHLEVMLKSAMITSKLDYRIPRVEDADNVKFGTLDSCLKNRHIGVRLAYQEIKSFIYSADSYIYPRQKSEFDMILGYTD